jgi:hypothetical protein
LAHTSITISFDFNMTAEKVSRKRKSDVSLDDDESKRQRGRPRVEAKEETAADVSWP